MKTKLFLMFLIGMTLLAATPAETVSSDSYDLVKVYEKIDLESGSKAMDNYGNIKDTKMVLVPTRLKEGKYEVELTKMDSNFYEICGTDYVVETKYCYEYATREDAILIIKSNYGFDKGKVIFID